jgi:hypothetical protein
MSEIDQPSLFIPDSQDSSGLVVNPEAASPGSLTGRAYEMARRAAEGIVSREVNRDCLATEPTYGHQGRSPAAARELQRADMVDWRRITGGQ